MLPALSGSPGHCEEEAREDRENENETSRAESHLALKCRLCENQHHDGGAKGHEQGRQSSPAKLSHAPRERGSSIAVDIVPRGNCRC